jgi:wyosine [tRNA(Phe)-imidazoG37] synthetase (radical SAM superfamily)
MYPPREVAARVAAHVARVRGRGEAVDHLTFVPDGEPTLDAGLARAIALLQPLGIPVAVISNGSLAWRADVREALRRADWVSIKVDTVDEAVWRRVNRPAPELRLATVLDGLRVLADGFPGRLVSETMLVAGVNDDLASVAGVGAFLREIGISRAYLAVPTRPPAVAAVRAPDEQTVTGACEILSEHVAEVELLIGYEGDAFAASGDARADLLAIAAVHPLRESAVLDLLSRSGSDWSVVADLERQGTLRAVEYAGSRFYVRRFSGRGAARTGSRDRRRSRKPRTG